MNKPEIPICLVPVINELIRKGAKPLLVGGSVRDWLLGIPSKDADIEIFGIKSEELISVLSRHGKVDQVGVSFGVVKLYINGKDHDFSLPRRENKTGAGHRGFIVTPDSQMSVEEACSRRDFTINSMAWDLTQDKLLDFFGGYEDLQNKTLRHVSNAFSEDPLRVLRGFQFAARFGMKSDPGTLELCAGLKNTHSTLAKERIWGEWEKWTTKGKHLLLGLEFLIQTNWIDNFYPLTKDLLILLININDNAGNPLQIFLTLCSGLSSTDASAFLRNLGATKIGDCKEIDIKVQNIIEAGHESGWFSSDSPSPSEVRRLSVTMHPATISQLCKFSKAETGKLAQIAQKLGVWDNKPTPLVMGRDLTGIIAPGPKMGKILKEIFEAQLDGKITSNEEGLKMAREIAIG